MPRLNKRAQRENESLSELKSGLPGASEAEYRDEPVPATTSGFATLQVSEPPSETSDQEDTTVKKSSKSKKKKKKAATSMKAISNDANVTPAIPLPKLTSKNQKKAAKASAKNMDDIDRALEELALKDGTSKPGLSLPVATTPSLPATQKLRELLSVSTKHLDGEAELRRFFGSKVVNSAKPHSKQRSVVARSQLTTPPPTWATVRTSQGLAMRPLEPSEIARKILAQPGDKWWTVEHSASYKRTQMQFLETVQLGDYEGFMQILSRQPWHLDSLLQMSEVARHQEDNTQASDLVSRALFAFERSFAPSLNFTTGTQRLDFDRIENRPFFLAIARYVVNLQKRGTNRTAFEFARLLFALDPGSDPHGALLYLDYLAVRAGMNEWLIEMWDIWTNVMAESNDGLLTSGRIDVHLLPGWMWSRALAMHNLEEASGDREHTKSTLALHDAILAYPFVLPVLADKAGISLTGDLRSMPLFRISTEWSPSAPGDSTLHLLSHIYAQRAFELWKVPEIAEWLRSTVSDATFIQRLSSSKSPKSLVRAREVYAKGTPEYMVRHVIVTENRTAMAYFSPGSVPQTMVSYDPVPPRTSLSQYDQAYFQGVAGHSIDRRSRGGTHNGDGDVGDEEEQRAIQQEQLLQQIIMEEIRARRIADGAVPGGFPDGAIVHDGEVDSDLGDLTGEDDDVADRPPDTGGFMQTMYNLVWGRGRAPPGDAGR